MRLLTFACFLGISCSLGCSRSPDAAPPAASTTESSPPAAAAPQAATVAAQAASAPSAAELGKPAPDFALTDLEGKSVKLSDLRGKVVVLEWFNPGCPFVKLSHTKGSLVGLAEKHTKAGVVWLAVNSGAPGKQGHGAEANREGMKAFGLSHPILLDESGTVGRSYGAKRTPHLFIVDEGGVLVYRGAVDNSPDGEKESPQGGALVNYVDAALEDLAAKRPVRTPSTEAYGCSVKYGS